MTATQSTITCNLIRRRDNAADGDFISVEDYLTYYPLENLFLILKGKISQGSGQVLAKLVELLFILHSLWSAPLCSDGKGQSN